MRVVIVMPTYNEADNLHLMIPAIAAKRDSLPEHDIQLLIVDDNSPDGGAQVVLDFMPRYDWLHLLQGKKAGLGAAYVRGLSYALNTLAPDVLMEMDADFSHDPADIERLLKGVEAGHDFVIGSRYVQGGKIPENWGFHRRLNSQLGNLVTRYVAGIPRVRDCTAGFRAIRADLLRQVDLNGLNVQGYAFQIALLYQAVRLGARTLEIPVNFIDRTIGDSKLGLSDIIEFFKCAFAIRLGSQRVFLRFCAVGLSGVAVNLGIFTVLLQMGLKKEIASPIAIQASIVGNFLLNNWWTFRERQLTGKFVARSLKFNLVSLISLGISYGTFLICSRLMPDVVPQIPQLLGVVPAIATNYFLNAYWTFRSREKIPGSGNR